MSRRMPLELKLPLLMSAVLGIVLGVTLAATYATLRGFAVSRVQDRLSHATRQIATLGAAGVATQHARLVPIANDSAIRRALRSRISDASTLAALRRAELPTDSGLPVELWTADGRRIAVVGRDVRATVTTQTGRPELPEPIASTIEEPVGRARDSLRLSQLSAEGDSSFLWYVMPVRDRAQPLGYIVQQRRISPNPQTQRTLRELSGDSVHLHWRNRDGGYWATGTGEPMLPFATIDSANGTARAGDGTRVFFEEERIGSTPLVVGMSVPVRTVLANPQRFVRRLFLVGFALFALGTLAAWAIGRSVARPLAVVTRAAGSLAAGDYDARVPETGDFEVRKLAQSFNHMAAEIGASRVALERQTAEAQQANSAKSEFLTTMSHELRTPLNAIGGYADLIDMELRGPVTDAQKRDLQRIKASQQHLLGLISSVLDLARIEAGRVNYEYVNIALDPFLAGIDALVAPQAAAKSLSLHYVQRVPDLAVVGDREKVRQVLLNLLSNAIRHTPAGGDITISAEPRGNQIGILVEDSGPGVPIDKRETIFEPFVQLDRSFAQNRDGIGLGLAISRDLARGMHGDLTVEEGRRTGARFVLLMPAGRSDDAAMVLSGENPVERSNR